jgi:hypothetical protein
MRATRGLVARARTAARAPSRSNNSLSLAKNTAPIFRLLASEEVGDIAGLEQDPRGLQTPVPGRDHSNRQSSFRIVHDGHGLAVGDTQLRSGPHDDEPGTVRNDRIGP